MKVKMLPSVTLTEEQLKELPSIIEEPDCGWQIDKRQTHKSRLVQVEGCHGTYLFRVNLSIGIIKILEVK
jgi:hypothetical protein